MTPFAFSSLPLITKYDTKRPFRVILNQNTLKPQSMVFIPITMHPITIYGVYSYKNAPNHNLCQPDTCM